jgi:outer membrane protein OmpA-like peptidoglycan-associated protein
MLNTKWVLPWLLAALTLAVAPSSRGQNQQAVEDMTPGVPRAENIVRALEITDPSKERERLIAMDVQFEYNSAQLSSSATKLLDIVSLALVTPQLANLSFRLEGHTDAVGSAIRNQLLSEARAKSMAISSQKGIDPKRLMARVSGRATFSIRPIGLSYFGRLLPLALHSHPLRQASALLMRPDCAAILIMSSSHVSSQKWRYCSARR